MKTLHLDLEIELEDRIAEVYYQTSDKVQAKLKQHLETWGKQYLQELVSANLDDDPWLEFLDQIDQYAVDDLPSDFSLNHEHYV